MRRKEINSTPNRISSVNVFHFLNFIDGLVFFRMFTFYIVFDNNEVRVYKYTKIISREITSLPETKNVMIMARHFFVFLLQLIQLTKWIMVQMLYFPRKVIHQ